MEGYKPLTLSFRTEIDDAFDCQIKEFYSDAEIMICGGMRSGKTLLATLLRAIRNGTPLPKGHGRLIDADNLPLNAIDDANYGSNYIKIAPTIIEGQKGSENE